VTDYSYDPAGNVLTTEDPNGVTATDTYTPLNQLASISYSDTSHDLSYVYDANGNRATMTDASGSSAYTYNPFDEVTSAENGASKTVSYTDNALGNTTDAGCLLDDVRAALTQSGLPSEMLTIEITETCLMRDTEGALRRLTAVKTVGVRIAIDDFGTGYSSLAYLQQFPVDSAKPSTSRPAPKESNRPPNSTNSKPNSVRPVKATSFARPLPPDQVEKYLNPARPHLQRPTRTNHASEPPKRGTDDAVEANVTDSPYLTCSM
jgi:YD repeat-containing protein